MQVLYSRLFCADGAKYPMNPSKPSVSLAALPGRRHTMLELAKEIERRGFEGIYTTSIADGLSFCVSLAHATERVRLGTSIIPIYYRIPRDFANAAAYLAEVSGGRFRFGIGVSHAQALRHVGIQGGKPLADIRSFVEAIRAAERSGPLPPIVLAAMRKRMIALAGEIAEGMVFANGARSHMRDSLSVLPPEKLTDDNFSISAMIPTCISDDEEAAKAVNRKTLVGYVILPNYRNYWREAGYEEEMDAVEKAMETKDKEVVAASLSDKWLADVTLFGSASRVREGIEAWYDSGVKTVILVPSSSVGNQQVAFSELFAAFE